MATSLPNTGANSTTQEEPSVPRLSIIIPHRHNDPRLEASILSALENRPENSEIIVAHDGSYGDPYDLSDEVVFVEGNAASNSLELINAGLMSACSPVVCVLLDGVLLSQGWAEAAIEQFEHVEIAAVACGVRFEGQNRVQYGIASEALKIGSELQRGRIELVKAHGNCAGPELACGFYRTKALRAIGGWNEQLSESVADVDLAWTLRSLGLSCVCDEDSPAVTADSSCKRAFSNASMKQLAELAVAYGVCSGGATAAMSDLLRGCLAGNVSLAVAWASGVMSSRSTEATAAKLRIAEQRLAELTPALKVFSAEAPLYRRHAA
jgi:hypothetical protein